MGTGCSSQRSSSAVLSSSSALSANRDLNNKPYPPFVANGGGPAALTATDGDPNRSSAAALLLKGNNNNNNNNKRPLSKPSWAESTATVTLMAPVMAASHHLVRAATLSCGDNVADTDAQTELSYREEDYDWDLSERNDAETQTYVSSKDNKNSNGEKHNVSIQTDQRIMVLARKIQVQLKPTIDQIVVQDTSCQTESERTTSGTQTGGNNSPEADVVVEPPAQFDAPERDALEDAVVQEEEEEEKTRRLADAYSSVNSSPKTESGSQVDGIERLARRVAVGGMEVDFTPATSSDVNALAPPASALSSSSSSSSSRPKHGRLRDKTKDTAAQTDNDILTDEAPEYAAGPPTCKKSELLTNPALLDDADDIALGVKLEGRPRPLTVRELVYELTEDLPTDLLRVRAIFRWITENISYDWKLVDSSMTTQEVIEKRSGACKDYVGLFTEMCQSAGIRVKKLHGFAKGYDYRPGNPFQPGKDISHAWNAVYVNGSWRLVDPTWGAGYTDFMGEFHRNLVDHYFFTDPEDMIWTHFPYDEVEKNYDRWQLLDEPVSLDHFNRLPKVTPHFFAYDLKIQAPTTSPFTFQQSTNVLLHAQEVMRYKYKLYPSTEAESTVLNQFVFCWLREQRLVGQFTVQPPEVGKYYLKVYGKPEADMEEGGQLECVAVFLLLCDRARQVVDPWPLSELPWGITEAFYDTKAGLVDQFTPIITIWGGKKNLVIRKARELLIYSQVFDADGNPVDQKSFVGKDETPETITLTLQPTRVGYYKLLLYGTPKPREKGRVKVPLIATFLVACKMINKPDKNPQQERRPKFLPKRV